jgi:hypothetical protein
MPDFTSKPPRRVWAAGEYALSLLESPDLIAKSLGYDGPVLIHYDATLVVAHRRTGPRMLINLERTDHTCCLCAFTAAGMHENYGSAHGMSVEAFTAWALEMFRKKFDFSGTITELG